MKKNIQAQLDEIKESITSIEERLDGIEPQTGFGDSHLSEDDDEEEKNYTFTQDEFQEFLNDYTTKVKEKILSEIDNMDMNDEEDLYSLNIQNKEIEVEIFSDEVSSYIDNNLSLDEDENVQMAHEVLDDLSIDYSIH